MGMYSKTRKKVTRRCKGNIWRGAIKSRSIRDNGTEEQEKLNFLMTEYLMKF